MGTAVSESRPKEQADPMAELARLLDRAVDEPERREEVVREIEATFSRDQAVLVADMDSFTATTARHGIVTFLMLIILNPTDAADPNSEYLTAVVVGALASAVWPLIWLLMIRRRRQNKMDQQVAEEVAKQTGGPG